jgi:diguanylate cyclase (GGDEF)-like protein
MNPRSSALPAPRAADPAGLPEMGLATIENGRLVEADASLCRIFACPPGVGLAGCPLDSLATEGEAARLRRHLREAGLGAAPIRFVFQGRRHDGTSVDLEVCVVPTAPGSGGAVFASFLDRNRRSKPRESRIADRQGDSRYERLFEVSGLFLWEMDLAQVWQRLQSWKGKGIGDIERHLREHPQEMDELLRLTHINSASDGARRLLRIDRRHTPPAAFVPILREQVAAIWDGCEQLHSEVSITAGDGKTLVGVLSMRLPRSEEEARHSAAALFDITERKAAEIRLAYLARFDPLTDLANRATFVERLAESMARARRSGTGIALHFLDLDRFKEVNDRLGHRAGDALLRAVGERLKGAVRETDTVARFGGDEFAVLQTDVSDATGVDLMAAKLIQVFAAPFRIERRQLNVTTSIGITVGPPPNRDSETMMVQADLALYRAKAEGRNRYKFHSEEMNQEVRARAALADQMREAIEAREFVLHYQPQIDILDGSLIGLEAHLRWPRSDKEMLRASSFLRLAEETGLIVPLGEWMLGEACRQLQAWTLAGIAPPRLAVRASSRQLKSEIDFEATLRAALEDSGIAPSSLELELSESVLGEMERAPEDPIARLRRMGVGVAIEGFGTGSCSLGYLTSFRVSRLKIARQFVHDILSNTANGALVRAILGVAREIDLEAIAEGVETRAQAELLAELGCRQMQGACFGQPVPAAAIEPVLKSGQIAGPAS